MPSACSRSAKEAGKLDYDAEIEGLRALDRHTLQVKLVEPDYILMGYMAHAAMSAVAREVVEAYGDASGWVMANPVGTGPFRLAEWRRGQKIVLEANPGFREERFPTAGEPADAPMIARMQGKRLPQVGRVEISIIEESNPQLLAFNSGELDYANVPPDLIPNALDGGNRLKPIYAEQGVRHWRITQPALTYTYFNMEDPVVGGYAPEKVALRRAIVMGFNVRELIDVWFQGQAMEANQPIPPVVSGHVGGEVGGAVPHDPKLAMQLLDRFGYRDRDGDGFRELPDGKPLALVMGSATSGRDRARDELWKKSMTRIGIRIDFLVQKWPDLLKMGRAGKLQMWPVGWITQYNEGDAFMQLLYSRNIGQSNYSRFALPEYDELYRQTKRRAGGTRAHRALPEDERARERLQPVGPRRVAHREHARAAVGRGLQEARVPRARVEVLRPGRRAPPRGGEAIADIARSMLRRGDVPGRVARMPHIVAAAGRGGAFPVAGRRDLPLESSRPRIPFRIRSHDDRPPTARHRDSHRDARARPARRRRIGPAHRALTPGRVARRVRRGDPDLPFRSRRID